MTSNSTTTAAPSAPLVDVHAHFVTPDYVDTARAAGHRQPDGMAAWPTWSAAAHLELMDRWGVATSFLSVSSPGTHFGDDAAARHLSRRVNEAAAEVVRAHPGRFGHFAALPLPDVDGSLQELAYALDDLGSDGAAIETNAGGVYLGDERFAPLYAELDRRRTVVFVHPTSPPCYEAVSLGRPRPMLEFIFDSARAAGDLVFSGMLTRFPGIEWIFTHGGGALPLLADRMELFRDPLFGEDPASPTVPEQLSRLWFDMAGTPFPRQIPALDRAFDTGRLLYGSDYCWTPAAAATAQVASVDAAEQPIGDTWRALTTRNAGRLLPRLRAGGGNAPDTE
ncbi:MULTISPECIES: amidohydrolase family protein [Streptomyces]|uniref:amidohydrolase family protein n=1 Tax=Streptomyces TaxID=1883 RepID=UPI00069A65C6|nr:amidohydrolase family protein [Streptomyces sp. SID7805]MYU54752.1 amidohydrolase family protein [Streptomyces sp. SID7805]